MKRSLNQTSHIEQLSQRPDIKRHGVISAAAPRNQHRPFFTSAARFLAVILAMITIGGCHAVEWHGPDFAKPLPIPAQDIPANESKSLSDRIELSYAAADRLESDDDSACVDQFFESARLSWTELSQLVYAGNQGAMQTGRLWEIYHSSVGRTIETAQKYGRFDPTRGIQIKTAAGAQLIPVHYHGFLWKPEDFNELILVGDCEHEHLPNDFRTNGLGVPLVVKRVRDFDETLRKREQLFTATAIIKNNLQSPQFFSLELFAPETEKSTTIANRSFSIARAPLAAYAYRMDTKGNLDFQAFRSIGSTANAAGLYAIGPYQPGKIPLILVHGLLSDPTTWGRMAAELMAKPEIHEKYQLWAFEYQTGDPFVQSAKIFRADLQVARETLDPGGLDPALDNIVVIGHSMGGLVAKLQITTSYDWVWNSLAQEPFKQLVTNDVMKNWLSETCFFTPQPAIKRVIFIGTPHRGATMAQQLLGWIASAAIKTPKDRQQIHQQLVSDNPTMFRREVQKDIPNSIDLLSPKSAILQAVQELPVSPNVALHTILGNTGGYFGSQGDGVVPVTSAQHAGVDSELVINALHTQLQSDPEAIAEVYRILTLHSRKLDLSPKRRDASIPASYHFSDVAPSFNQTPLP